MSESGKRTQTKPVTTVASAAAPFHEPNRFKKKVWTGDRTTANIIASRSGVTKGYRM